MSTTVERVKEFCKTHHDNVLVGVNHRRWMLIEEELLSFLSSLASERCVWKLQPDKKYPGLGLYFPIDHPEFLTFGFYQQSFDEFKFCPYCGKQIEVKEADNG